MKFDIHDNTFLFYGLLIVCALLIRLPVIGIYLRTLNTLIHEIGHALVAVMVSGQVIRIDIFNDTSGTTLTKAKSKIAHFMVAIAGYPFSSIVAFLMFFLIYHKFDDLILYILLGVAITSLLLFVRNQHGIIWLISFVILTTGIIIINQEKLNSFVALLYSTIIMADALLSTFQLFIINLKKPKQSGDSSNLQKLTKIPSLIWSVFFVLQSGIFFYYTIRFFFPAIPFLNDILK